MNIYNYLVVDGLIHHISDFSGTLRVIKSQSGVPDSTHEGNVRVTKSDFEPVSPRGPVSGNILSQEMNLNSLITMATIIFSMLKIARGLKIF